MKSSLKYVKFKSMSHHFPHTHSLDEDEYYREFIILNIFISVLEEREKDGIKYSRVKDLSNPSNHNLGGFNTQWVALSRKEIEKHTPIGSVEELVDMTLGTKKQKGLNGDI